MHPMLGGDTDHSLSPLGAQGMRLSLTVFVCFGICLAAISLSDVNQSMVLKQMWFGSTTCLQVETAEVAEG